MSLNAFRVWPNVLLILMFPVLLGNHLGLFIQANFFQRDGACFARRDGKSRLRPFRHHGSLKYPENDQEGDRESSAGDGQPPQSRRGKQNASHRARWQRRRRQIPRHPRPQQRAQTRRRCQLTHKAFFFFSFEDLKLVQPTFLVDQPVATTALRQSAPATLQPFVVNFMAGFL